jgi:uncharacterized protein YbjT (DUF2867 family)
VAKANPTAQGFARAHVELPRKIAARRQGCTGVRRVLHVSALKAAADAPSGYLRSKAAGEAALQAAGLDLTIFRPSVIFGAAIPSSRCSRAWRRSRPFPAGRGQCALPAGVGRGRGGGRRRQPAAIRKAWARPTTCAGRRNTALAELVRYATAVSGHPRAVIGLPEAIGWLQAWAMEFIPNGPMTRDNIRSMRVPSVCDAGCGLPFGRVATALEVIAPTYLRD